MARRKPDKAGDGGKPVTGDLSAKMLEVYAGMMLDLTARSVGQGEAGSGRLSRSETLDLTLTPDDRTILLGLPELGDTLEGRLEIATGGDQGIRVTVEELAGRVGASRSSLAQRFSDLLGQAPMQYLTRWRLTIAAQRLRDERVNLARLAEDSGYESEAAFNRAFKRALGATPGAWRKARLHRQDAKDS